MAQNGQNKANLFRVPEYVEKIKQCQEKVYDVVSIA